MPAIVGSPPEKGEAPEARQRFGAPNQNTANEFCYPAPSSVKGRCLGALLCGYQITHLSCWRRFGSARLSHHIYILRGLGWDVSRDDITVQTSDAGRQATIGRYYLTQEVIDEAGERGQRYAAECARIERERRAA